MADEERAILMVSTCMRISVLHVSCLVSPMALGYIPAADDADTAADVGEVLGWGYALPNDARNKLGWRDGDTAGT